MTSGIAWMPPPAQPGWLYDWLLGAGYWILPACPSMRAMNVSRYSTQERTDRRHGGDAAHAEREPRRVGRCGLAVRASSAQRRLPFHRTPPLQRHPEALGQRDLPGGGRDRWLSECLHERGDDLLPCPGLP